MNTFTISNYLAFISWMHDLFDKYFSSHWLHDQCQWSSQRHTLTMHRNDQPWADKHIIAHTLVIKAFKPLLNQRDNTVRGWSWTFLTSNWRNIFTRPLSTVTAVSLTLLGRHVGHSSRMGLYGAWKKGVCTADPHKDKGCQCSVCRPLQQHNRW